MSPLARSLLALACAALIHASSADVRKRVRAGQLNFNNDNPAVVYHKQGLLHDKYATRYEIPPYLVMPTNDTDFFFDVPNVAKENETLIGQELWVLGDAVKISLEPETQGKHSPIRAHCKPRCIGSVAVLHDQYVIPKLF